MFNPFREIAEDHASDVALVEQAQNGDGAAMEKLVLRHQAWIYNIAVRMVFDVEYGHSHHVRILTSATGRKHNP